VPPGGSAACRLVRRLDQGRRVAGRPRRTLATAPARLNPAPHVFPLFHLPLCGI